MRKKYEDWISRDERLYLGFALNYRCNLACKYCFEGNLKKGEAVTQEMVDDFLLKTVEFERVRRRIRSIRTLLYGGEPLLTLDLVEYASRRTNEIAAHLQASHRQTLVTNGTLLTRRVAHRLRKCGITEVDVSLDGTKSNHDKYRPFKSGRGSYDTIVKNIAQCADVVDISIRANSTCENHHEMHGLFRGLVEAGVSLSSLRSVHFGFLRQSPHNVELPAYHECTTGKGEPWLRQASLDLVWETFANGFNHRLLGPRICVGNRPNSYLLAPDGIVYRCPARLGHKEMAVSFVADNSDDRVAKPSRYRWETETCLKCPYLPMCFGGCIGGLELGGRAEDYIECIRDFYDATIQERIYLELAHGCAHSPQSNARSSSLSWVFRQALFEMNPQRYGDFDARVPE
ncbi:radical SAM protein [Desulfosarcina variabilis]|uniref:radical SAM protein n=1 Tax=Desulfosarcina variabilis TaxID=2300 RepID=UPI003AFB7394